jgi:uncharacterized protein involved in exopolysaccharide biosynthesis
MNLRSEPSVREASILDYARILMRHWRMILLVCMPVVAVTAVWSLVMTKTYRATASIVPPINSMQGGDLGLAGSFLSGGEGAFLRKAMNVGSVADIYVGILGSRAVLDRIVSRLNLLEVYGCRECRWVAVSKLRANTEIKVGEEGIVEISVVDTDPVRAAAMANAYVEELDSQNKRLSTGQATSKRLFLETRLKEVEAKLSRIETIPAREAQVQEMLYELLIRELELAKIEEAKSMPTIQVLDNAVPPEQKFAPNRRMMVMKAGVGSLALAIFLALLLEYRQETKQVGLAQQSERAIRRRKMANASRADPSGGNGAKKQVVTEDAGGAKNVVAKP